MQRHHNPHFYDSAEPRNVPSGALAAVYVAHGSFQWDQHDVDRMRGVFGVSENPDRDAARLARCIAIEPHAGNPEDAPRFLDIRHGELHHHDGTVYVNRSNWDEVEALCLDAGHRPRWWVSTLDGTTEVRSKRGTLPWAVQYGTLHGADLSICYGVADFTLPHHFQATG